MKFLTTFSKKNENILNGSLRWNYTKFGNNNLNRGPTCRGGFNERPLVQWPTRPLGGWALEAPGLGPGRLNFGLQLQSPDCNVELNL